VGNALIIRRCSSTENGNIFSLDVAPDYEGKLRKIDVKTLRQVGKLIGKSGSL